MAETPTLRPLGVGEILDAGIKLYVRHWKPLMICVVGIALPVQILTVLVLASVDPSTLDSFGSFDTSSTSSNDPSGAEAAAFIIVAIVSGLSTLLATAACFKAVADAWLGARPEAGRSLRFALRNLLRLVWLAIVWGCGLTLGFIALIVPGVWLFVAWSLAVPALLFERTGAFKSLGRSFRLVRGRWWPVCGALVVAYLLAGIISGIVQLIPEGIAAGLAGDSDVANGIAAVIGGTVSAMISTPFTAAVVVLLYFDQRVRKEGFDLQLLAEGLGTTRDPDAPLPAPLVGPDVTPEQRAAAPYWPPPPGWVPPEPAPTNEPNREWWQDPVPSGVGTYSGGFEAPQSEDRAGAGNGTPPYGAPSPGAEAAPPHGAPAPGVDAAPPYGAPSPGADAGPPLGAPSPGADAAPPPGGPPSGGDADPPSGGEDAPPSDPPSGGAAAPPSDAPSRDDDSGAGEARKRDRNRADWLPPEAPRGPGGL